MAARAKPVSMKVVVAAVFVGGWSVLVMVAGRVNVPSPEGEPRDVLGGHAAPSLIITRTERLPAEGTLREQLFLLDPSPLFMPVRGAGAAVVTEVGDGGGSVDTYAPALRFYSDLAPAREIWRSSAPESPEAAARQIAQPRWFAGLAREDEAVPAIAAVKRAARVDVYLTGAPDRLAAVDVARVPELEGVVWRPLVLSVLVNTTGAIAPPVVVVSSGIHDIDERFRSIVGRELLPTLLLRPGVYRLEVGP